MGGTWSEAVDSAGRNLGVGGSVGGSAFPFPSLSLFSFSFSFPPWGRREPRAAGAAAVARRRRGNFFLGAVCSEAWGRRE